MPPKTKANSRAAAAAQQPNAKRGAPAQPAPVATTAALPIHEEVDEEEDAHESAPAIGVKEEAGSPAPAAAAAATTAAAVYARPAPVAAQGSLFFADVTFANLGLDTRLWKALASAHLTRLTLVQKEAIPHMLQGANVLVQARTGSGKTLAYAIPLVQQILLQQTSDTSESTRLSRIVLLPSIELCEQVRQAIRSLLRYCDDTVRVVALKADTVDPSLIRENPDIIVATPAQLLNYCQASAKKGGFLADLPRQLRHLVLDEADLVLGQGYAEDLTTLLQTNSFLGRNFQISLFSATLDEQIEELKQLYMPPPCVTIKIRDPSGSALGKAKLTQLFHRVHSHQDKFFMTLCLLQTQLVSAASKVLVFINTIEDAYKLKLFLEQFGIASAVLNHELPRNSRMSILDHFNRGLIDILIATDEAAGEPEEEEEAASGSSKGKKRPHSTLKEEPFNATFGPSVEVTLEETASKKPKKSANAVTTVVDDERVDADADEAMAGEAEEADEPTVKTEEEENAAMEAAIGELTRAEKNAARKGRKNGRGQGFGASNLSRGVDFKGVGTVLCFDFPTTIKTYTHRVGRTARADRSGVALSFVEPAENELLEVMLLHQLQARNGMPVEMAPGDLQPLPFDEALLNSMRYRCEDKIRAVTRIAIREARLKEIKMELLNSERLKSHFEDNPRELALLRHDQVLRSKGIQKHLATLPSYLLPEYMQNGGGSAAAQSLAVPAPSAPTDKNRNALRRNKHKANVAAKNQLARSGALEGKQGFALKKAKGLHTQAMKKAAGDPLRTFRAKPLNATATASSSTSSSRAKVDF